MVGQAPAREEETARLTGARGDFVGSLGRRVEALRTGLRAVEGSPNDAAQRNGLLRRVHALASAARVLGFASVAEALTEAEKKLRKSEFADVARALDLLPSLVLGMPVSLRPSAEANIDRATTTWPLSVLIFGAQALAEAIKAVPGTHVECERTEDLSHAKEQARLFGPDLAIIDADRAGARELVEAFSKDPGVEPVPLVVVGDFASPEAASSFISLGAARVLSKPVGPETLQRTVVELRALAAEPRTGRDPLGELSVEGLADRIAGEVRRGLLEAVEPSARNTAVGFGDGADVMAAVWGAVARVRELVTLRSSGAVRFDPSGPEGAVPFAGWDSDERRAGERGSADNRAGEGVSLQGRRIVVADDDPAVVWFMSDLLKAMGVEVLEAHDGARALALAYDAWPDLVVSDVLMPKLDGFSLCHEIKRDVAVRDVPVILLSWKEDLLQRVRELGGAADGYLRKEAAAATVAERLREVLRARARVEQRIAAGGDARGRLDGLTPRLILELAGAGQRDVRVGIRDAVYLYEVQVRRGRLCSATRSGADGSFERGEAVLAALLGVSAGRFIVEPDSASFRGDFAGVPAQILKAPIERARRALNSISAGALVGVTRVQIDQAAIAGYLGCTPEPARGLLQRIIDGASPHELITSGAIAPRLLEAVLSDVARRGAIRHVERAGDEPSPLRGTEPPAIAPREAAETEGLPAREAAEAEGLPAREVVAATAAPVAAKPAEITDEDEGWFAVQLEVGTPAPQAAVAPDESRRVATESPQPVATSSPEPAIVARTAEFAPPTARVEDLASALLFNAVLTPSVDRLSNAEVPDVFDAGASLGIASLPEVRSAEAARPVPTPNPKVDVEVAAPSPIVDRVPASSPEPAASNNLDEKPEIPDAVAVALSEPSPEPARARPVGATQVMAAVSMPETETTETSNAPSKAEARADTRPPSSRRTLKSTDDVRAPLVAAKATAEPRSAESKRRAASSGGVFKMLVGFVFAVVVSYTVVSYFKADVMDLLGRAPSSPASPR